MTRYEALSAQAEYQHHKQELEQRFADLTLTDLNATRLGLRRAQSCSFKWSDGERQVLLVEVDASTYRILYNPRSPLNQQIRATLEWIN